MPRPRPRHSTRRSQKPERLERKGTKRWPDLEALRRVQGLCSESLGWFGFHSLEKWAWWLAKQIVEDESLDARRENAADILFFYLLDLYNERASPWRVKGKLTDFGWNGFLNVRAVMLLAVT